MADIPGRLDGLDRARRAAGLGHAELYLRYFALGGMASPVQVEAFCYGALLPGDLDYDRVAHAINERFAELGQDHPVPYSDSPLDLRKEPPGPG